MWSSRLTRGAALAAAVVALSAPGRARATNCNPELEGGARPEDGPREAMPLQAARKATPQARLVYFGGRIISDVEVVMVLWGGGAYEPFVTSSAPPSMSSFFAGVTGGPYLAGLAQYDTTRAALGRDGGTDQRIGQGRFAGLVRISPSAALAGRALDDVELVAELRAQLDAGRVPPPSEDRSGNVRTLYVVHLPAGRTVTLGHGTSCKSFCAYHGSFPWRDRHLYYMVMPDMSAGSGCERACGGDTPFRNATSVASHELAEAITDPDVGSASGLGPPLAWYDPANGEIADICGGQTGMVQGVDGAAYLVQKLWSNSDGACVVTPGIAVAAGAGDAPVVDGVPAAISTAMPIGAGTATPTSATNTTSTPTPTPATTPISASGDPLAPILRQGQPAGGRGAIVPASLPPTPLAPVAEQPPRRLQSEPAPAPQGGGSRFTLEEENDALAPGPHRTDQFYTQGARLTTRWDSPAPLSSGGGREQLGVAVGQNIYTPSDIRVTDLDTLRHDRPYAGWLYAAILWDLVRDDAPFSLRLGEDARGDGASTIGAEVAFGTTGPRSGAGPVQTNFHRLLRDLNGSPTSPPDPAGWDLYQTRNRLTFDMAIHYEFDLLQAGARLGGLSAWSGSILALRLSPRLRVDAGTMFDAAWAGLEVRTGLMAAPRRTVRPALHLELYGFARADGRWVAYNGFIQGPLLHGVTPLVGIANAVGDLDVGAVLRVGGLEVAYSTLWRTSELAPALPGARPYHRVGQVQVSFVY
jgi:hypothetical protein